MLPHPVLATDDDAAAIVRSIERLPSLLDHFFQCLETVYIDTSDSDANAKLNTAYINIQWHMLLLDRVPAEVFMTRGDNEDDKTQTLRNNNKSNNNDDDHSKSDDAAAATTALVCERDARALVRDTKMPLLLHRLTRLFLDDVIGVGPQALTWKKPCQRVARECAEHIQRKAVIHFPRRLRTRRQFVSYDSFAFVLLVAACVMAVVVVSVVAVVVAAVRPSRAIGVSMACVAVVLLLVAAGAVLVHYVAATRALQLLYNDVFAIQVACGGGIDHWLAYARQRGALSTALARYTPLTTMTTTANATTTTATTTAANATAATTTAAVRGDGVAGNAAVAATGSSMLPLATSAPQLHNNNNNGDVLTTGAATNNSTISSHHALHHHHFAPYPYYPHNNNNNGGGGGVAYAAGAAMTAAAAATAAAAGGANGVATWPAATAAASVWRCGYYALHYGKDRVGYIDGRNIDAQLVMIAYDSSSFVITRWNSAAEAMTGFLADGCVGKPLSELVMRSNGGDICDELRSARKGALIKIKLRTLATAPVAVFTMVTPIVDAHDVAVGSVLVCASPKDDLREYRCYIHNFHITEVSDALTLLLHRNSNNSGGDEGGGGSSSSNKRSMTSSSTSNASSSHPARTDAVDKRSARSRSSNHHNYNNSNSNSGSNGSGLSPHDVALVTATRAFIASCTASRVEELAREMISVWEWTTVEQIVGRALGNNNTSNNSNSNSNNNSDTTAAAGGGESGNAAHVVHIDPLFPQTLCASPAVSKVIAAVVSSSPSSLSSPSASRCSVALQMLNLTSTVFALSVTVWPVDKQRRWDSEQLQRSLRPLLRSCAGSCYCVDDHVTMHFPCQVAAILEDVDASATAGTASSTSLVSDTLLVLTQARAVINCSVNVVTAVGNMVDQHNLSLILLKTMFVSLASVRERGDLEQRLSARPCDVDVVICDSEWLRTSRDILFGSDHGAIIVPFVDDATPLSHEFAHVMRMPIVGRDVQQVMVDVGKRVAMKKNAAAALKEREHILTLRQDSPWTRGRLLGRGSYGAVYEATSDLTGGRMAVKMFYFAANSDALITQLLNEIKIMCSLNHPNIVHYFHCERKDNDVNLFMELCDCSLSDLIVGRHAKPLRLTVTQILRQVLSAVAYLHSRGVAHRDIKPQNILLKGDTIKLTDFGTARKGDVMREVQGTFRYMAPEVYKGMPHTLSCDVWSFGCLVCELFACPTPFMEHAYLLGEMTSAAPHLEHVPQNMLLRDLLYRCFRVNSAQRPSSQELLTHALLASDATFAEVDHLPTVFTQMTRARAAAAVAVSAFSISSQ